MIHEIDIDLPVRTVYDQWTQFEDFPLFMKHVRDVRQLDPTHTHWKAKISGVTREWTAEITEQTPDQRVAWTATDGTQNAGVVTFHALNDNTTRVVLQTRDRSPGLPREGRRLGRLHLRPGQEGPGPVQGLRRVPGQGHRRLARHGGARLHARPAPARGGAARPQRPRAGQAGRGGRRRTAPRPQPRLAGQRPRSRRPRPRWRHRPDGPGPRRRPPRRDPSRRDPSRRRPGHDRDAARAEYRES